MLLTPLTDCFASPTASLAAAAAAGWSLPPAACASFSDLVITDNMTGLRLPVSSFTCTTSYTHLGYSIQHHILFLISHIYAAETIANTDRLIE